MYRVNVSSAMGIPFFSTYVNYIGTNDISNRSRSTVNVSIINNWPLIGLKIPEIDIIRIS